MTTKSKAGTGARTKAHSSVDFDVIHKALSNPVRRDILTWLKTPEKFFPLQECPLALGVCAGQIYERSGLSQSGVSAHLASLQKAQLVQSKKVGQWIFFTRNEAAIAAFLRHIGESL